MALNKSHENNYCSEDDYSNQTSVCLQEVNTRVTNSAHVSSRGNTETRSRITRFIHMMKAQSKSICVLLAVCITALAALHNGTLRTRKVVTPDKLFDDPLSLVVDYELGNLKTLSTRAMQNDVSFVMYYAHWDSECIRVKKEFETIARHYSHQIFFAAINCWWPEGECRKYYNLKRYPLLLAHVRMAGEVEYKGPLLASYIMPFLDNLVDPVTPIQNEGDLLDLRSKHDAVLIGYFDFNESPQPPGYKQYFTTAVKALSTDPWRLVSYAVITNRRVATKMNLAKSSTLNLFLWNTTEQYSSKSFKSATIMSWVYSRVQQVPALRWLTPSGYKSSALSDILTKNPTFVLFTPRSFVLGISPYFVVLREVVMDYHNCDNSPIIRSVIHRSILRRHLLEEKLMELEEKCHEMLDPESDQFTTSEALNKRAIMEGGDTCCHSQTVRWRPVAKFSDKKCFCTACVHISVAKCPANCQRFNCLATASRFLTDFDPNIVNSTASFCNEIKTSYQPKYTSYYRIIISCSGTHPTYNELDDKFFITSGDALSNLQNSDEKISKMVRDSEIQLCHRLKLGLNYSDLNFPDSTDGNQQWRSNFTGLGCRANRTLKFAAIDSVLFPAFAESLGIDVFNETHATVGVIIDNLNENVYLLSHESSDTRTINKRNFVEFIKNFTSDSLTRFLKNTNTASSRYCLSAKNTKVICVPEISSEIFSEVVLDSDKDVVLMYYAPWCGFCSSIAHIYLDVARFFADVNGIVFARINGDSNDLPWEFTVDRYPTILFYPAKRKMDSIPYPSSTQITKTSLLQFILMNAQSIVRIQASLQLCNRSCLVYNYLTYSSHSRLLSRRLRNRLYELHLLRDKMSEIFRLEQKGLMLTKRATTQIKELRKFSKYLINSIRKLKRSSHRIILLHSYLYNKIQNYDISAKQMNRQLFSDIITLFNRQNLTKTARNSDNISKKYDKTKNKTTQSKRISRQYSKQVSKMKDEL